MKMKNLTKCSAETQCFQLYVVDNKGNTLHEVWYDPKKHKLFLCNGLKSFVKIEEQKVTVDQSLFSNGNCVVGKVHEFE